MSLQRPNLSGPSLGALLSAVLSVLLSLIVAALIGSRVGDDYQTRALVYVSLLLWSVVGAGVLLYLTRRSTSRPTLKRILLWTVSSWLWPLMAAAAAVRVREVTSSVSDARPRSSC